MSIQPWTGGLDPEPHFPRLHPCLLPPPAQLRSLPPQRPEPFPPSPTPPAPYQMTAPSPAVTPSPILPVPVPTPPSSTGPPAIPAWNWFPQGTQRHPLLLPSTSGAGDTWLHPMRSSVCAWGQWLGTCMWEGAACVLLAFLGIPILPSAPQSCRESETVGALQIKKHMEKAKHPLRLGAQLSVQWVPGSLRPPSLGQNPVAPAEGWGEKLGTDWVFSVCRSPLWRGWLRFEAEPSRQLLQSPLSPPVGPSGTAVVPWSLSAVHGFPECRINKSEKYNWGKSFPAVARRVQCRPTVPSPRALPLCQAGTSGGAALSTGMLEAGRSYHHASAFQGVAGPLEVVPADAVELADVVPCWVVDAVQVGETTGVEPPACQEGAEGQGGIPGWHPWVLCGCPTLCSPPDSIWAHLQRQLSLSASRVLKRVPCGAIPLCCPAVPL